MVLADIISSDYGSKKKCSTHYETVHAVVYDTVYKKKCSEGSDEKCKIVHIHSYKVILLLCFVLACRKRIYEDEALLNDMLDREK